jgi:predicted nucleic acid-binding protein
MGFLLDTNIISELRKAERCHRSVMRWYEATPMEQLFTSVLVLGELRRGIENLRRRDVVGAGVLEKWHREIEITYEERILPITSPICDIWGRLCLSTPLPAIDALLAATAIHYRLTLVTRNTRDIERSGAACLNPFSG